MRNLKAMSLLLAAVVALGGLSACNQGGGQTGAQGEQGRQDFGRSYVQQLPEEEVRQREAELTSPASEEKGPAIGSQLETQAERQENQQNQQ